MGGLSVMISSYAKESPLTYAYLRELGNLQTLPWLLKQEPSVHQFYASLHHLGIHQLYHQQSELLQRGY